ncbi:MAG: AAA family ATPase [Clostridiales bacterium]|jgi:predicted ATPase|nr:AAA family ATPase [Clostridiales bacterium]
MIKAIKIQNFLSFADVNTEIDIRELNIIIGRNGSGKSSFIEAIDLLRSAPSASRFADNIRKHDAEEWLYKGYSKLVPAKITYTLENMYEQSKEDMPELKYTLSFTSENSQFKLVEEKLSGARKGEKAEKAETVIFYDSNNGNPLIRDGESLVEAVGDSRYKNQSLFSMHRDHLHYPVIASLADELEKIKIYRNWLLGPSSPLHQPQRGDVPGDQLSENLTNLPLVINRLDYLGLKKTILEDLSMFYKEIEDYSVNIDRGMAKLYFVEEDMKRSVSLISDGLLQFLCLLSILRNPNPPPVICIEEPETGLHPGILPTIGDIMKEFSLTKKCKLIVTTHATDLVDTFTDSPEDVLVAEKDYEGTWIKRLKKEELALDENTLGELWGMNLIGGNLW